MLASMKIEKVTWFINIFPLSGKKEDRNTCSIVAASR
jgi:hypothetical protein